MFPVNKSRNLLFDGSHRHLYSSLRQCNKSSPKETNLCDNLQVTLWHYCTQLALACQNHKRFAFRWLTPLFNKLVARDALRAYLESISVERRRCQAPDKRAALLVVWLAMRPPRAFPALALQRHQLPPLLQLVGIAPWTYP